MSSNILFISLLSWLVIVSSETILTPIIKLDKGSIRGKISTTVLNSFKYSSFLGIPYGEPAVGDLRFKPPVEKKPWTDIMNATEVGDVCSQYNSTSSSVIGSEDCLNINVFTPYTTFQNLKLKPVMIFIHGGGFDMGYSNPSLYGPDFIIEKDVIMVSFNYRLNAFGFLNLNHDGANGNMGLKDQNLALKWVKKNIDKFGGDPTKVTIFGQSAGSASVDLHVLSDLSVGLFERSISMSGSPLCLYGGFQTQIEAEQAAFNLGSYLGIHTRDKDKLLEHLLKASTADIVIAVLKVGWLSFKPTLENTKIAPNEEKFLTQCSVKKYLTGNFTKKPHMMGLTENEMLHFAGSVRSLSSIIDPAMDLLNNASVLLNLPIFDDLSSIIKEENTNLKTAALRQYIREASNLLFDNGIDTKQQLLYIHNNYPIYYYRFSFGSNYTNHKILGVSVNGVGHGDELPYIFYMPVANLPLNQADIALTRERMVIMWTNFAKYGNPTPDNVNDSLIGIKWVESGVEGKHLEIQKNLTIGSRPIDAQTKLLQLDGLGASPILNNCSYDVFQDIINSLSGIFGLIG